MKNILLETYFLVSNDLDLYLKNFKEFNKLCFNSEILENA